MIKKILVPLSFLIVIPTLFSLIPKAGGSPGGKTGSKGDVQTCTQCHTGTAITAAEWISTEIPEEGYIPGETYPITLSGDHSGVSRFGFELTAENKLGIKKGTFIITDAVQTKLANNNKAVTHTSSGLIPTGSSKSWSFTWTAPEAGSGEITLFAALNAANGNNGTSGDVIYTTQLSLEENTTSGIYRKRLNDNAFKAYQTIDPNTLIVEYSEQGSTLKNIRIFDMKGRMLISRNISDLNLGTTTLNIQDLNPNIYLVQIQTDKNLLSKKILINK